MRLAVPLVLLLLLPSASGAWRGLGSVEPGYAADVADGFMFEHADTLAGPPQVYFDAFLTVEQLMVNPNVALLGSRILAPGATHHHAFLGLWKDCNGDGYVGLAESAILDYRAELVDPMGICYEGSIFNDGRWVSEMIMIGMVDPCEFEPDEVRARECNGMAVFHENPRVLYANGTMVWADVGRPGQVPRAECVLLPLPHGATSGSGALIGALDCQSERGIAAAINAADPDGSLGLRFEDAEHPEASSSILNQRFPVTPFGGSQGPGLLEPGSGAPSATAWDCSAPKGGFDAPNLLPISDVPVADPTGGELSGRQTTILGSVIVFADEDRDAETPGVLRVRVEDEDGSLAWVPAPAPAVHDPSGSAWDAAEHALDGPRGDCDGETALRGVHPGPLVEGRTTQIDAAKRDRSSLVFTFYDGHRGLNDRVDPITGASTPADGGVVYRRNDRGGDGPMWNATAVSVNDPQLVTRGGLQPQGALYFTYYAKLGPAVRAVGGLPPGGEGEYGAEACGTGTTPQNGWICDPEAWWRDAEGNDARPRYHLGVPYAPLRGETYQMRDVDCYDGRVTRDAALYASLATLDETC